MDTRNITRFFKGFAILLVFLCHSHQTFNLPGSLNEIFSFLQVGVQLFLLLSAMGLCFSYSKAPITWLSFMKKRISKIALSYWFAILLASIYRVAKAFVMHDDILEQLNPLGIFVNALLLHGLSPDKTINNQIVRGGWFIGAIIILYAIFPLIYKIYFSENKIWKKSRVWLFPLSVFVISSIVVFVLKYFNISSVFSNLFLQLTPFCLGFPLFELQKQNIINELKFPLCKALLFFVASLIFYFIESPIQHFYVLSISITFFYIIAFAIKRSTPVFNGKSLVCKSLNALGEYSFSIYLTHSYIAFDFCYVATVILSRIYVNDLLWFVLLQPFVIVLTYFVGKIFNNLIDFVMSKFKKLNNKNKTTIAK